MKRLKHTIMAIVAIAGLATQANAHLVTPAGNFAWGNDSASSMSTALGTPVMELFKWDAPPNPAGGQVISGSGFTITFDADLESATLAWDLTGTGYEVYGVAWKDGSVVTAPADAGDPPAKNDNLAHYWSAVTEAQRVVSDGDTINLQIALEPAFRSTAWSHIAFYGKSGPSVPDSGTTLMLLGFAFAAVGAARRYLNR